MKNYIYLLIGMVMLGSCAEKPSGWVFDKSVSLEDIAPLGMAVSNGELWLSDSDENLLVRLENGKVAEKLEGFERPMHIAADEGTLYVPEFGIDTITLISKESRKALTLTDSLDAPAGVDVFEGAIAIADFYNHRILYFDGGAWASFGQKGHADGEFYYPTDVQIVGDKIYVADAYNNRVQVFDLAGFFIGKFGEEEKMNAATGIYISDEEAFVTDFENDRVLVYDLLGKLKQILDKDMNKPTDLLIHEDRLVIANYKAKRLDYYKKN